jgi:predicted  nucleic acid-binding Zn-ribbon protein
MNITMSAHIPVTPGEKRIAELEAENKKLSADASWAATHRSELADLREAFEKREAENAALRAQVERLSEALENLIDPFTHNPLCECKNCKAKAVLIAAWKEAGMFYRNGTANELAAQKNRIAELERQLAEAKKAVEIQQNGFETMRDAVLNERGPLAESGLDSDQINSVLGIMDDNWPINAPQEPA